jgi:hypothetical protein
VWAAALTASLVTRAACSAGPDVKCTEGCTGRRGRENVENKGIWRIKEFGEYGIWRIKEFGEYGIWRIKELEYSQ